MKKNEDVEIYHRINKLKLKAGLPDHASAQGQISSGKIQSAQTIIDDKEEEYPIEVSDVLSKVQESWAAFKNTDGDERDKNLDAIYNYSNQIKDLTTMYNRDLMSYFSESLRDFCEKINPDKAEHHVIVQAHIDVMLVTYEQKLLSETTPEAEELKKVLAKAIQQNS